MPVPSSLALTNIADGASAVAADHRNNFTAIQTAVNAIIGFLAGGSTGALLRYDGSNWAKTANVLVDDTNSKFTFGATADTTLERGGAQLLSVLGVDRTFVSIGTPTVTTTAGYNVLALSPGTGTGPGAWAGGGQLFVDSSGRLAYKGTAGTVTVVAAA